MTKKQNKKDKKPNKKHSNPVVEFFVPSLSHVDDVIGNLFGWDLTTVPPAGSYSQSDSLCSEA